MKAKTLGFALPLVLLGVGVVTMVPGSVLGAEKATIVNLSPRPVTFNLKWSFLPYESQPITLMPWRSWSAEGPDGARLWIRYNATPLGPVANPRVHLVATWRIYSPYGSGYVSWFRPNGPFGADLKRY